ncbi:hypothetical protein [Streptomyces misionensis]|uniref:hypothetical protein n=1 Tax=Streptomyces misionensis TaxID=67331 RepID=UPI0033B8F625
MTDTETIDFDLTGTGTAGDPYEITGSVKLDPAPPGGGSNLLQEGPDGLFIECADVRGCFSATGPATYDPATGTFGAKISADAGNQTTIGADGGIYTPAPAPAEVGCGLVGDGSAASPITANPARGQAKWSDSWTCDAASASTLRCDPATGYLWTPPEHYTAADHIYQEHMQPVVSNVGVTNGWLILQPGGAPAVVAFDVPPNFLGNQCRDWSFTSHVHASIDVSASSTATFELGYVYQIDGGALQIRPIEGVLTAFGSARRERYAGSVSTSGYSIPAGSGVALHYFVAVRVTAGTITLNSWTSDGTIHTTTQG